jgi:glycine dehydrogenase subunit 1
MDFTPHTKAEVEEMLATIGVSSIDELFSDIDEHIRCKEPPKLPKGMHEVELVEFMQKLAAKNLVPKSSFLGAGTYFHFVPAVVGQLASRAEFLTSYTPYQAEASQGVLQSIFEFQTFVCELTAMDVANASMYDGSTAVAEAALMAVRVTKRNRVLVANTLHPEYKEVLKTYVNAASLGLYDLPYDSTLGVVRLDVARKMLMSSKYACVIVQYPNFFGCIEPLKELAEIAHNTGTLLVVATLDATALGLLMPPGEFGADIAVGELQALGNPPSFGGPHAGYFATKHAYLRQLPGRIVGETKDEQGRRGYVMTLQTREQHIRRERATSNICTNAALCALRATIFLAYLGKHGFQELAEANYKNAHYAFETLVQQGVLIPTFEADFYNEFVMRASFDPKKLNKSLLANRILGPLELARFYPELERGMLFNVTELHSKQHVDELCRAVAEVSK